jgi:hypothetical protein
MGIQAVNPAEIRHPDKNPRAGKTPITKKSLPKR